MGPERLEQLADAAYRFMLRNRWAPLTAMLAVGFIALVAALVVYPGADEWSYWFGIRFGGPCGFEQATGLPCPSCGMTRSWIWLARGHVARAFSYNAAGATLLIGLWAMGILGAVRLLSGNFVKFPVPFRVLSIGGAVWTVVLFLGLWIARLFGVNPLP